jgi:ribose/xylose/arabinose/galactoside ABC-type transport system permease subunit
MLAILAIFSPTYFRIDNARVIGLQMATLGIASVGTAFLIISRNIDLSIGSIFGMSAMAAAIISVDQSPIVALVAGVALATALGFINGVLVWRIPISPIIITLGTLSLYYGITLVWTQGRGVTEMPPAYTFFGRATPLGIPLPIWALIAVVGLGHVVLSRTTIGRHYYAIGGNREAAQVAGIRVRRLSLALFAVNGTLIGIAAVLAASRFGAANPQFGIGMELDVITAVILGGVAFTGGEGGIAGVILAVALLVVINSGMIALGIDPYLTNVVKGGALLIAVGLDQLSLEQRERYRTMVALREASATAHVSQPSADPTEEGIN